MPAGPWPCMTRHMPWPRRDIVSRSESLKRWPTVALSAKMGCAPSASPPHICAKAFQVRGHACSAHSPQPSSTRPPRANHPSPGAVSPRNIRPDPIRKAFRAARCGSSRRMASWWARVHASVDSSSWPVKYAASASFSRSSRSSGVAASAVANCAYASPHERWAKDARACSSTPILITGPVWCVPVTICSGSRGNGRLSGWRHPSSRWLDTAISGWALSGSGSRTCERRRSIRTRR